MNTILTVYPDPAKGLHILDETVSASRFLTRHFPSDQYGTRDHFLQNTLDMVKDYVGQYRDVLVKNNRREVSVPTALSPEARQDIHDAVLVTASNHMAIVALSQVVYAEKKISDATAKAICRAYPDTFLSNQQILDERARADKLLHLAQFAVTASTITAANEKPIPETHRPASIIGNLCAMMIDRQISF